MLAPRTGLTKISVSSNSKKLYIGLENLVWNMCSDYYSQTCIVVLICSCTLGMYLHLMYAFDLVGR